MEENYIYCPSCGKKIRNSVVFCPYCNTQFGDSLKNIRPADGTVPPPSPDGEYNPVAERVEAPANPPSQPKNANMKWLAVAGAVLVVALIAGGIWFALGRDKKTAEVPPTVVPTAVATEAQAVTEAVPAQVAGAKIPADCKPYNLIETFFTNARTDIAPVTDADWVKGPADAEFTIIVYSDFQ